MNHSVRNICVYCGSGHGHNPIYTKAAQILGQTMAEAGIGLVYGGGGIGLMGEIAAAVLEHSGYVTGVIPSFLTAREHPTHQLQKLIITRDMHERKRNMFELSDAFVALPGGVGTLEELVEQLTWAQLGQHTKPIVLADVQGFWRPLLALFDHMRGEAFIRPGLELSLTAVEQPEEIVPTVLKLAAQREELVNEQALPSKF